MSHKGVRAYCSNTYMLWWQLLQICCRISLQRILVRAQQAGNSWPRPTYTNISTPTVYIDYCFRNIFWNHRIYN